MKMFSIIAVFLLFVGCQKETTYQTVKIKKQYSVELPSYLEKTDVLNPASSLQYQNVTKEFYILIFDESKNGALAAMKTLGLDADFTSYSDAMVKDIKASLQNADFSEIENVMINGLEARTFSVTGYIDGVYIYYKLAHIKGKNNFYQIMTWTAPSRKEEYGPEMDKIIASFSEFGTRGK